MEDHLGLCGLVNSGNSCYMNAVLQCLCSTIPLVDYCLQRHKHLSKFEGKVARAFFGVVGMVWLRRQDSWTPSEMQAVVRSLHPQFNNHCQQDSQELLLLLLSALHDDLKQVFEGRALNVYSEQLEESQEDLSSHGDSIISHLFEGQLYYVMHCMKCNHQTHSQQVFTMLSLPIPNSDECSLQDCLRLFFKQSILTLDNCMLCPECGVKQETAVLTSLTRPPEILVLHLKRFDCEGAKKKKLKTNVLFSLKNLDLNPFLSCPSAPYSRYSLYAVVNHTGDLDRGHYTACCYSPHVHSWHQFDDNVVNKIQDSMIQSPSAYILFYSLQEFRCPDIPGM
ncbi:putative ubiquitin carboxyl-terminal hydrolase 50 [Arapaima gigas]